MNRISKLVLAALCSLSALSVGMAQNAPQTPQQEAEKAVKTRQGLFEVQGFAFGPVGAMLKDAPFDAGLVQKEAARVAMTAAMIPEVFQLDTRQYQMPTKARESIWVQKSEFDKKAGELRSAAEKLESTAKAGDRTATLNAVSAVGQACKACHDDYRAK